LSRAPFGPITADMSHDASPEELARRIVDLEVGAAFQTRTIEALDAVVREFAARVESLERTVAELAAGNRAPLGDPQDEPPSWV
jgi:uncharacterized coiled-coil protein SlyX